MKSETTKRLFRAISARSWTEVDAIAKLIVSEERSRGHGLLARQLSKISEKSASSAELTPLPTSHRDQGLHIDRKERDQLRHDMVLRADVEARLARIEAEFLARDRLLRHGLRYRSRVLLFGPPGCGKTMAAERLAYRLGLPMLKVQFDSLISSLFGESASNLREVFDSAQRQPCVFLLDECDFIARSRTASNDIGEVPRIVNTLLQLMESFGRSSILVATTNIRDSLDLALFRRFDDSIEFAAPETDQVVAILKGALAGLGVATNIRWHELEHRLVGLSAAELVRVAENAAKDCVLSGGKVVEQSHFDRATCT